eukprot:351362-Chlamydomonas_euryale.AAC.8
MKHVCEESARGMTSTPLPSCSLHSSGKNVHPTVIVCFASHRHTTVSTSQYFVLVQLTLSTMARPTLDRNNL